MREETSVDTTRNFIAKKAFQKGDGEEGLKGEWEWIFRWLDYPPFIHGKSMPKITKSQFPSKT
jgi:hypothetical protein